MIPENYQKTSNKPNILILYSDQHNARCFSCAGHPEVKTPNLDRLASDGIRFENAYCQNPICTPSRMSFLSSTYPSTHGYYGLYGREPDFHLTSMFRYFREQGYRTGALGKLHTPRYWIEKDCQYIYDEFLEYPNYLEGAGLYNKNDSRGFCNRAKEGGLSHIPLEHSCESVLARQAFRFIDNEGEPKDRWEQPDPWMAWVSFSRPHQPLTPSDPFASMYLPDFITLPPTSESEAEEVKKRRKNQERFNEQNLRHYVASYFGLISQVDDAIGNILRGLEQRGILENTIIIYTADHGDYAGEHGLWEKVGGISYRCITRPPLIVRYPQKVNQSRISDAVVESVDVFPTLCELSDLPLPDHAQGQSFAAVLSGTTESHREHALTENCYRKALATDRFRYIANIDGQQDEMYDLQQDPWELDNKLNDTSYKSIASKLQRTLLDRVVRARRPVTTGNGGWLKHVYDRDGRKSMRESAWTGAYW
jgi:arylsulfatase